MTSLAQVLVAHNVRVTGSDGKEQFFTDTILRASGIHYYEHFSRDNIPADAQAIIYSTAYSPQTNEELIYAQERGIPLHSYPEFLGLVVAQKLSIAVCGTHGKTTTTAMMAHILKNAGKDPSAVVGSTVVNWKSGALSGTGANFVFEADEYQNKFQQYHPWSVIVTNVDFDHVDFFSSIEQYQYAFQQFLEKVPAHGFLVVNADDDVALDVSSGRDSNRYTFGYTNDALYHIREEKPKRGYVQAFSLAYGEEILGPYQLTQWGRHNTHNAAATATLAHVMGIDTSDVIEGLADFRGTVRRMESKGIYRGAEIIDDYAHHPREIEATLEALSNAFPTKEIIVVFQPHTYSRTEPFLDEFATTLSRANAVLLLDIYSSARELTGSVSSTDLSHRINALQNECAANVHTRERAVELLKKSADKNTIIVTMGAGDVWRVGEELLQDKSQ